MTSVNQLVLVLLVVLLAVVFKNYLQLKEKYEELKIVCETSCLQNLDHKTKNEIVKGSSSSSIIHVFMHSSTREENIKIKDDATIFAQRDEYIKSNEPTLYNKIAEKDLSSAVSSANLNNIVDGIMYQTSNAANQLKETKNNLVEEAATAHGMDSTNHDSIIDQSESSSVQITLKNIQSHHSYSSHSNKENLSQSSEFKIAPSVTESIHVSTSAVSENMKVVEESYNTYRDGDTIEDNATQDNGYNLDVSQHRMEILSSDSTIEERIFVLQTSLQEEAVIENEMVYNYLDVQDSTPVLNTGMYGNSLRLMTDSTEYYNDDSDEDMCGAFSCQEDEEEYNNAYVNNNDDYFMEGNLFENSNNNNNNQNQNGKGDMSFNEYIVKSEEKDLVQFMTQGTSAWCDGESAQRTCKFQNLCYNTKERDFIFFKGEQSVVNISGKSNDLGDIFYINLSTIQGHNSAVFSIVTLPTAVLDQFSIGLIYKKAVVINRFKPDNLMHVLHDDVLPLLQTFDYLNFPRYGNVWDAAIVFTDIYEKGSYFELYSSLSIADPISPWQFNDTYDLLCFPDIQVGLQTSTIWYQYGFFQPQGPVSIQREENVLGNIRKAVDFLSVHFKSDCLLCSKGNYLVFLSRKDSRLILNEGELVMSIIKSTRLKVMTVSLETHSLSDIITTVRLSRGVVGMHGSLLSLSIFLPPGSVIIELFPFAVNPSNYTPFKTFCELSGSGFVYRSWSNPSRTNSIPHPDRPANEGGIQHLPHSLQYEISSQSDVPKHLCCEDPSWLYHIYQDTIVDVNSVVSLILDAIHQSKNIPNVPKTNHDFHSQSQSYSHSPTNLNVLSRDIPGSVKNLQCGKIDTFTSKLTGDDLNSNNVPYSYVISWEHPWIFSYDLVSNDFEYEVVIQQENNNADSVRIVLPTSDLSYQFESKTGESELVYNVWVRVLTSSGAKGLSKFTKCIA